mmetsp:Transcript_11287/g.27781  ORF Transcript_11287/g.27781 Transcript_11287/m.27781 type:complete len:1182 (+) Transcript_11287:127-3672(+)
MGVPSFYRWLSKRFPRVVVDAKEEEAENGRRVDTSQPNPNGVEFDNLYLDMNGIIHPCCHPEDKVAPATEEEMILEVFKYIDRIFAIVRPRKLLYMAIDGVAPRAKMNQQRSRRFRSAKEAKENAAREAELREEWMKRGFKLEKEKPPAWDSNVITPGTPFMHKLAKALHYYIHSRLESDPGWRNIMVLFSDASVPGEGEHKIMHFIRMQRAQRGYDPNTKHCLYGMDADLIMLGLATHDPHFTIIREEVIDKKIHQRCFRCGMTGHVGSECTGDIAKMKEEQAKPKNQRPYQLLRINVLREYLEKELEVHNLPFEYDFEKMIDDWVMLCFLVGNDFLPHLPSLSIREGAIVNLTNLLKEMLPQLNGYITENNDINRTRLAIFLAKLGEKEDDYLTKRERDKQRRKMREAHDDARRKMLKEKRKRERMGAIPGIKYKKTVGGNNDDGLTKEDLAIITSEKKEKKPTVLKKEDNLSAAARLRKRLKAQRKKETTADENIGKESVEKEKVSKQNSENPELKANTSDGSGDVAKETVEVKVKVEESVKDNVKTEMQVTNRAFNEEKAVSSSKKTDESFEPAKKKQRIIKETDAHDDKGGMDAKTVDIGKIVKKEESTDMDTQEEEGDTKGWNSDDDLKPPKLARRQSDPDLREGMADWEIAKLEYVNPETHYRMAVKQAHVKASQIKDPVDNIRFGEPGWKERYYRIKMGINIKDRNGAELRRLLMKYTEGLVWVYKYYYEGCPSWSWYFPFHYSPMASDLGSADDFNIDFKLDKPFTPLTQLMGVLPSHSAHCLPPKCQALMTSEESPIIDFYPIDFDVDLNGKKYLWQAVALLPWIEESRLTNEVKKIENTFTEEEKQRNTTGNDLLFVHQTHPLGKAMVEMYDGLDGKHAVMTSEELEQFKTPVEIKVGGLSGFLVPSKDAVVPGCTTHAPYLPGVLPLNDLHIVSAVFVLPTEGKHVSKLLPTLKMPARVLNSMDFYQDRRGNYGAQPRYQNFHTSGLKNMDGNWAHREGRQLNNSRHRAGQQQNHGQILNPMGQIVLNPHRNQGSYQGRAFQNRGMSSNRNWYTPTGRYPARGTGRYVSRGRAGYMPRGRGGYTSQGQGRGNQHGNRFGSLVNTFGVMGQTSNSFGTLGGMPHTYGIHRGRGGPPGRYRGRGRHGGYAGRNNSRGGFLPGRYTSNRGGY